MDFENAPKVFYRSWRIRIDGDCGDFRVDLEIQREKKDCERKKRLALHGNFRKMQACKTTGKIRGPPPIYSLYGQKNKSDISHLRRGEWRTNHTNGNISHNNSQLYSRISDMLYRDRLMREFFLSVLFFTSTYSRRKLKVQVVYSHGKTHVLLFY